MTYPDKPIIPPIKSMNAAAGDFLVLTAIGLTKTQARCYGLLSSGKGWHAGGIAKQLNVSRTTIYRQLEDLSRKGFVLKHHIIGATTYRWVPLPQALVNYQDYQLRQVRSLLTLMVK